MIRIIELIRLFIIFVSCGVTYGYMSGASSFFSAPFPSNWWAFGGMCAFTALFISVFVFLVLILFQKRRYIDLIIRNVPWLFLIGLPTIVFFDYVSERGWFVSFVCMGIYLLYISWISAVNRAGPTKAR